MTNNVEDVILEILNFRPTRLSVKTNVGTGVLAKLENFTSENILIIKLNDISL